MSGRQVQWEGFYNARDLGGLPRRGGGVTARGGYVRSADLRFATEAGLERMREAGIGTVVDLRNGFETRAEARNEFEERANAYRVPPTPEAPLPDGVFGVREPLDSVDDLEFWVRMREEGRLGSPRFFTPVLREQPERVAAVLRAIAHAPGGVLFHCAVGRDRTGLVAFTLLALADVEPEAIAADYELSVAGLAPFFARLDYPDPAERIAELLASQGHTIASAVAEQLDGFDAWATLRDAGLTDAELARLRGRLVPEEATEGSREDAAAQAPVPASEPAPDVDPDPAHPTTGSIPSWGHRLRR
ncbi:tyrosine-protein phosphatase [Gulosibacter faecalis]|uniref:Tyrosine-protein phosphatase n=1 Tax=Gulosibacter faecalis TaxID=272240 RepID=A0ABW5UVR9_9MICO|nr:tyrosine-protein phosphatase [Gulosibacter faecalis]